MDRAHYCPSHARKRWFLHHRNCSWIRRGLCALDHIRSAPHQWMEESAGVAVYCNMTMCTDKSFADVLFVHRGVVSSRVALLLRSAETKPLMPRFVPPWNPSPLQSNCRPQCVHASGELPNRVHQSDLFWLEYRPPESSCRSRCACAS